MTGKHCPMFWFISHLMLTDLFELQMYRALLDRHEELLVQLDVTAHRLPEVQKAIDEFEAQKICYLPLTTFFLKPVQRLLHYQLILDRKWRGSSFEYDYYCRLIKENSVCMDSRNGCFGDLCIVACRLSNCRICPTHFIAE